MPGTADSLVHHQPVNERAAIMGAMRADGEYLGATGVLSAQFNNRAGEGLSVEIPFDFKGG